MPAGVESGLYYRTPAWHHLGDVAKEGEWPTDRALLRKRAGLEWEITEENIEVGGYYAEHLVGIGRDDKDPAKKLPSGQIVRAPESLLAVQPVSYKAIRNGEFLDVVEEVLGQNEIGDFWQYEALFSLHGGKRIIATLRAREPLKIPADPAHTYSFATFASQHDGSGGLRGIPANFRVECANLWKLADQQARSAGVGFTIRHTENWRERVGDAKRLFAVARQEGTMWAVLAEKMSRTHLEANAQQRFLRTLMPVRDDMSDTQVKNTKDNREQIYRILHSRTCEGIETTVYGMVQAVIEWADHVQPAHSDSSRTSRTLMRSHPTKQKAFSMATGMMN